MWGTGTKFRSSCELNDLTERQVTRPLDAAMAAYVFDGVIATSAVSD